MEGLGQGVDRETLGAFLVNATTEGSWPTTLAIATGNTLEGLLGAVLINRWAGGRRAFERPADVFRFAFLAVSGRPFAD